MKGYKQLSYEERMNLAHLKQSGLSIGQIALKLCRSKSTLSRELRRNQAPPGQYWPDTAHNKALDRKQRGCVIDRIPELKDFIENKMRCHYWTPEQIAGWLKNRQKKLRSVCHETIYAWIYRNPQKKEKLWRFLPRHKAKRGPKKYRCAGSSRIPNRVPIHQRPDRIEKRQEFGHWEGDLMSFMKNTQHILVLQERKTRYVMSAPLNGKKAVDTAEMIAQLMVRFAENARKTVTFDNGGEFAAHENLENHLGIQSFFCDPYASWQKGGIENANGRLRRDLPRKTDIKSMKEEDFYEVIDNYNTTPRKCLNWKTPEEVFFKNLLSVALQT
jgi:IS30 family transposase